MQRLVADLQAGLLADAARLMHTLKGVAGTLGAEALARQAARGELLLRGAGPCDLDLLRSSTEDSIAHTRAALSELVALLDTAAGTGTAPRERDAGALVAALLALQPLLADSDMGATDVFAELQAAQEAAWPTELQPLADALTGALVKQFPDKFT